MCAVTRIFPPRQTVSGAVYRQAPRPTGFTVLVRAASITPLLISMPRGESMWRVLVPLLQFVFDCWLLLGAFALISSLAVGLWGIATHRHTPRLRSFSR